MTLSKMKRNSHIHVRIETENLEKLKQIARSFGLSLSEFCRKKLLESSKLDKIEFMLEQILKQNEKQNRDK